MTSHVLVAVDLTHSDEAGRLVGEAAKLTGFYGAALTVVTVLPDYRSSFVASFFPEGALERAEVEAMEALRGLADTASHEVRVGSTAEEVVACASERGADMIVVGAHQPDAVDRLLGINAARIVRMSPVSVFVVRL